MKIAVIPARGGSKRIPRKNIKSFCGKPIIAWTIETAIASCLFDNIIVSTDDQEIAAVAKEYGAEIPFMRPSSLSDDFTTTSPVVAHAIQWYREIDQYPDEVCWIYPTAPFVTSADLQRGLEILNNTCSDYVVSVTRYPFPIQRAIKLIDGLRVEMYQPEFFNTRSQDLEEAFHDAGQFYWGRAEAWIEGKSFFSGNTAPVILPRQRVQDIDTLEDFFLAESMFMSLQKL